MKQEKIYSCQCLLSSRLRIPEKLKLIIDWGSLYKKIGPLQRHQRTTSFPVLSELPLGLLKTSWGASADSEAPWIQGHSRKSARMVRRGTVYPSENGDFCCHTQKSQQIWSAGEEQNTKRNEWDHRNQNAKNTTNCNWEYVRKTSKKCRKIKPR